MEVSQQLFQITADGKRKDGKARRDGAPDTGSLSREEYEAELSILMTEAHAHRTHTHGAHIL